MPHGKRGVQLKALIQDIRDLVQYVKSTKLRIAAGHPSETVRLFIRLIDQGRFTDAIELLPSALVQALGVEPLESILYSDSKEVRDRGGV